MRKHKHSDQDRMLLIGAVLIILAVLLFLIGSFAVHWIVGIIATVLVLLWAGGILCLIAVSDP